MTTAPWSENMIAAYLARVTFARKSLVMVPRCSWTGSECDLLVVTVDLRVIDVEVKISRADLRADARKDKWYHAWDFKIDGPYQFDGVERRRRRQWPARVWKNYYAVPGEIWTPDLLTSIPEASGVLLLRRRADGEIYVVEERRAKPCRSAERISAEDAVDIARLASLRMWDALDRLRGRRIEAAA